MRLNNIDSKLIFLISQPRAGSTLTQKILGNHPEIHTISEPWLMLHPLYALKNIGHEADYNTKLARAGLENFLNLLSHNKESIYFESIAQAYGNLYRQMITVSGKSFFLDKTPRYYNIIPELYQTFPEARFIILLRNPLAVLCSILNTWIGDRWLGLRNFKHDILQAPNLLLSGIELLSDRAIVLHYEQLLQKPDCEMSRVFQRLGIEFFPDLLNYGQTNAQCWRMGDKKNVYQKTNPDSQNIDRWIADLNHPQVWRLVNDYLELLGTATLQRMGYDYAELRHCLDEYYPGQFSLWNTMPLSWLLKEPDEFATWNYGYYPVRLLNALQRKGLVGTGVEVIRKLTYRFRRKKTDAQSTNDLANLDIPEF
jgi:hypothetical protein